MLVIGFRAGPDAGGQSPQRRSRDARVKMTSQHAVDCSGTPVSFAATDSDLYFGPRDMVVRNPNFDSVRREKCVRREAINMPGGENKQWDPIVISVTQQMARQHTLSGPAIWTHR